MNATPSTGWTMDSFVRWAFGPLPLARMAVDVDLARRSVGLLKSKSDPAGNRRRLGILAGRIESQANQHFLLKEAELAGALARRLSARDFQSIHVADVAEGFQEIEQRISGRLAQMGRVLQGR